MITETPKLTPMDVIDTHVAYQMTPQNKWLSWRSDKDAEDYEERKNESDVVLVVDIVDAKKRAKKVLC